MRKQREESLKPGQAGLIVTYGNTTRKYCPLEGDLVILGRSPVCEMSLISPEVAAIHCLIQRTAEGWRIRDCSGGRHATRLNGRPIHAETLRDTDVLQIGAFSFEVRLPSLRRTPFMGSAPLVNAGLTTRLKRLHRSRRNLARLALKLRQRVRRNQPVPPTLAELEQQAGDLRNLQRDYDQLVKKYEMRLAELETVEREVCDERVIFEQQCQERQAQLQQAEHELSQRQNEAARRLDRRRQELDSFARYLRRCQEQQLLTPLSPSAKIECERSNSQESAQERLSQLHRLKPVLARSNAPSAPGDQLRTENGELMDPVEQPSVDCTVPASL